MPPSIPVFLAPHNPAWPKMASEHAAGLRALGSPLAAVHHIGSTSVPGLAAKPIIDLMPLVTTLEDLDRKRSRVEALGYSWYGELGITGRRYCALSDEGNNRIAQLHFFAAGSQQVVRHLAFRDYLRAHPEVAHAYEEEKRRARDLYPNDSHSYSDEKAAWIKRTEAEALVWSSQQTDQSSQNALFSHGLLDL
jgi:GrpB-like predicted nucleotidyltransferase (UPF0157 family)